MFHESLFIKSFEAPKIRVFLVNFYFDTTFPTSLSKASTIIHKISWDQFKKSSKVGLLWNV